MKSALFSAAALHPDYWTQSYFWKPASPQPLVHAHEKYVVTSHLAAKPDII